MPDAPPASDSLTGLKTPSYFQARLEEACAAATREGAPLSLLVIGLDPSETAGERVLAGAARAVARAVRGSDTAAHIDGGRFAVLLPGAGLVAAIGVGERILRAVREERIALPEGEVRVTASAGLACTEEGCLRPGDLQARAAAALEAARRAGRDRLAVLAGGEAVLAPAVRSGEGK